MILMLTKKIALDTLQIFISPNYVFWRLYFLFSVWPDSSKCCSYNWLSEWYHCLQGLKAFYYIPLSTWLWIIEGNSPVLGLGPCIFVSSASFLVHLLWPPKQAHIGGHIKWTKRIWKNWMNEWMNEDSITLYDPLEMANSPTEWACQPQNFYNFFLRNQSLNGGLWLYMPWSLILKREMNETITVLKYQWIHRFSVLFFSFSPIILGHQNKYLRLKW